MSDDLIFRMGEFDARVPVDRVYSDNHLWLQPTTDGFRIGLTAYSVRLLHDVYFVEWTIQPPQDVTSKQEIGEIESSKALSNLYSPSEGKIIEWNQSVLDDPSLINTETYDGGWLFLFQTDAEFMTPEQYLAHLQDGWEETQRRLKGRM